MSAVVSSFLWTILSILTAFVLFEIQLKLGVGKLQGKDISFFLMSSQGKIALLSIFYSLTFELIILAVVLLTLRFLKVFNRNWLSYLDIFSLVIFLISDLTFLICYILGIRFSVNIIGWILIFIWLFKFTQDFQKFRLIYDYERLVGGERI